MGSRILDSVLIAEGQVVPLLVLCISVITFIITTWLTRSRRVGGAPGLVLLRSLLSQAVEARSRVHLTLGKGSIGGRSTVETTAGLTLLDYLARQAVLCDTPVTVSVGDPTTLAAAQGILQGYMEQREEPVAQPPPAIHFIAPDPTAYACGTASVIESEEPALNVALGTFGPEYLLIGESAARTGTAQIAGTTNPEALALMQVTADEVVIGEEIFSTGAFLDRPQHLGSSLTEDVLRIVTALLILAGVVLVSARA